VRYHPGGLSKLDAMTDTDYARSVLQCWTTTLTVKNRPKCAPQADLRARHDHGVLTGRRGGDRDFRQPAAWLSFRY
jgi:hypothetical protein